jgi:hypothetical protein
MGAARATTRRGRWAARITAGTAACIAFTAIIGFPRTPPTPRVSESVTPLAGNLLADGAAHEVAVDGGPELVALSWANSDDASFSVRAHDAQGWSDWLTLSGAADEAPDGGAGEQHGPGYAGPAFVGRDVDRVEVRQLTGTPRAVRLHGIDSEPEHVSGAVAAAAVPPPIISRAGWGADESWRDLGNPGCDGNPHYSQNLTIGIVHHTGNRNDYTPDEAASIIRGIYYFHTHTNGWCDVAYNFFVDRFGRTYEGRFGGITRPVIGGHASGFNSISSGVAMLGDYSQVPVPAAAYNALRDVLAFKLGYHGVDPRGTSVVTVGTNSSARWPEGTVVTLPNLEGHRDSNQTGCPGQYLYDRLPQLRLDVARLIAAYPDQRLVCDWNGDGRDEPTWFVNGAWYVRSGNDDLPFVADFGYGQAGDIAVCGDWDGDGRDTAGVVRSGTWYLTNTSGGARAEVTFGYGNPTGDIPVVGDWDGTGRDRPGIVRSGRWFLRLQSALGGAFAADLDFGYGDPGDRPVVGDWNDDGIDTPGIVRGGAWYLRNTNTTGTADSSFGYGGPSDRPVPGDWDADGDDTAGLARGSMWFERNQSGGGGADVVVGF